MTKAAPRPHQFVRNTEIPAHPQLGPVCWCGRYRGNPRHDLIDLLPGDRSDAIAGDTRKEPSD